MSDPVHTDTADTTRRRNSMRVGLLKPLRLRDFRLLWSGMTISFIGDGVFVVALAWQVYAISNAPTALSIVSFSMALPMVLFLLFSGVLSDRFDRRHVMIAGDVLRLGPMVVAAILSISGTVEIWHLVLVAIVYGVGEALFYPAFGAVVPDLVPQDMLTEANSLDGFVRNGAERLVGPALGGAIIAAVGVGWAFAFNAVSFAFSIVMVLLIAHRPEVSEDAPEPALQAIKEGFAYARSQPWLIATLLSAFVTILFIMGPIRVLLPFIVKNELNGSAGDLGIVYTAGGVGAIIGALILGQRGLPRRHILFMYMCWGVGIFLRGLYGFVDALWQAIALEGITWMCFSWGQITWTTLMHTFVPTRLLGRVTSLDWLISLGLFPVSLIFAGPVAEAIGVRETMVWSGILATIATFAFLAWPGIRATETDGSLHLREGPAAA